MGDHPRLGRLDRWRLANANIGRPPLLAHRHDAVFYSTLNVGRWGANVLAHVHAAAWGPGPRPNGGLWGHHAPRVLIGAILATVGLGVLPEPGGSPLGVAAMLALLVVVVATWVQLRRHDRSLCEHCLRSMPRNPSLDAERFHRRLALAHAGSRPGAVVAYLCVLLGADVGVALAPAALSSLPMVLWAGVQSTLVYLVLSHVTHRRLQPWCPQCGGGVEGRDESAATVARSRPPR